jgi:Cu/Ag efflux pump CusA
MIARIVEFSLVQRVMVCVLGGMLTAAVLILVVLPVFYEIVHRHDASQSGGGEKG